MKNQPEFGAKPIPPAGKSGNPSNPLDCAGIELLWAEAVEGILPAALAEQVRAHTEECASCREKLAQAHSGREWLLLLKPEPLEPSSDMVARILATTSLASGQDAIPRRGNPREPERAEAGYIPVDAANPASSSLPAWQHNSVVVLRRTFLEPRLALVAAMAFFSISLTLNLMGVRLTNLRAADLEPWSMRQAVSRQYAEANARVARYYENLRIVYEVESQVRQLRQAAETSPQPGQTSNKSGKQAPTSRRDSSNNDTDSHRGGMAANPEARTPQHAILPDPKPVSTSPLLDAAFDPQGMPVAPQVSPLLAPQAFRYVSHAICFSMSRFSTRERRLA